MSDSDIVRAWKDEQFRESLDPEQQVKLPSNPAGEIELNDSELGTAGGADPQIAVTAPIGGTCATAMCINSLGFTVPPVGIPCVTQ
ncbi:MAG TPA: mersacidin/lichenicidin family type 2 lantibiotic [Ktedonobacteraceae bacterium]|nr:mersacidin/lichenicidin family type 2 lantibiotic [Ktedonobacteraceae bacterium]